MATSYNPPNPTASALLCACGVSYNIGTPGGLTQAPYYAGAGFTSTPVIVQPKLLPDTAACIIGQTNMGAVLAFQGTIFNSLESWITDFVLPPVSSKYYTGMVHSGFYLSLMEIIDGILTNLKPFTTGANSGQTLYITGHSKGGAMASLLAWYLQETGTLPASQIQVMTFASPMPGDSTFAAAFQSKFQQTNYINYLDIVPFLPPSKFASEFMATLLSDFPKAAAVLEKVESWDYTQAASTVEFIQKDGTISDSIFNYADFYFAIGIHLATLQFGKILAAHSHACGGGYMNAICPGLCSSSASPK